MDDATLPAESLKPSRHVGIWVAILMWIVACCVALGAGLLIDSKAAVTGGLLGLFAIVPLPFVAVVQLGELSTSARAITFAGWAVAALCGWAITVLLTMAPYMTKDGLAPGAGVRILIAFALSGLATLAGLFCFVPEGRKLAARWLPINPSSFTAASALALAVPLTFYCLIPLAVTGKVSLGLAEPNPNDDMKTADIILPALGAQLVWLVLFAVVAGGFPIRRNFRDTMNRLGVGRISLPVIGIAVAIAVALVCCIIPLEIGVQSLWKRLGWPMTDEKALEQMLGGIKTWYGAIVVGVVAGISEELLVRGLLQPRLGLVLSNLLFTAGHAFQYHWDALLLVFLIGLVCGLVRKRYNTTTSMIVHGLYDTIMVLLATYAEEWLKQIAGN